MSLKLSVPSMMRITLSWRSSVSNRIPSSSPYQGKSWKSWNLWLFWSL